MCSLSLLSLFTRSVKKIRIVSYTTYFQRGFEFLKEKCETVAKIKLVMKM